MYPYIGIFLIVGLALYLSSRYGFESLFYVCFVVLVAFAGFREGVGVDYWSYIEAFDTIRMGYDIPSFSAANVFILNQITDLGVGNAYIFLTYSLLTLGGVFYFCKKLAVSKELAIFIFFTMGVFYLSTFNNVRQWLAISFMLVALVCIIEKKLVFAGLFISLAIVSHSSAWVLLICPFLTIRYRPGVLILFLLSLPFLSTFANLLISESQYVDYTDTFRQDGTATALFGAYLVFLVVMIYFSGYLSRLKVITQIEIVCINMCFASLGTLIVGFSAGFDFLYIMRFNAYFLPQIILMVPIALARFKELKPHLSGPLNVLIITALSVLFFYTLIVKGDDYLLTPYVFASL